MDIHWIYREEEIINLNGKYFVIFCNTITSYDANVLLTLYLSLFNSQNVSCLNNDKNTQILIKIYNRSSR